MAKPELDLGGAPRGGPQGDGAVPPAGGDALAPAAEGDGADRGGVAEQLPAEGPVGVRSQGCLPRANPV